MIAFPDNLDSITIKTAQENIRVVLSVNGESLFDELLFPADGALAIPMLSEIVREYMSAHSMIIATVIITAHYTEGPIDSTYTILAADRTINTTPEDFIASNFLSTLQARRIPQDFSLQLNFIAPPDSASEVAVKFTAAADGNLISDTFALQSFPKSNAYTLHTINLQSADIESKIRELSKAEHISIISLIITAGQRIFPMYVDPDISPDDIWLFSNCFNATDFLFIPSQATQITTLEKSTALINGRSVSYDRRPGRSTQYTLGPLLHGETSLISQLLTSPAISHQGQELMITEFSSEINEDSGKPLTVKLSARSPLEIPQL